MNFFSKLKQSNYQIAIVTAVLVLILAFWKPHVLIEGLQRACLYAVIALPMALILGIVGTSLTGLAFLLFVGAIVLSAVG